MASKKTSRSLQAELLDETIELSLSEMSQLCRMPADRIFELVDAGVIEPLGREPSRWRFRVYSIRRVRRAERLKRDLGVNSAGAALALDLLEELERLRTRLRRLEELDER